MMMAITGSDSHSNNLVAGSRPPFKIPNISAKTSGPAVANCAPRKRRLFSGSWLCRSRLALSPRCRTVVKSFIRFHSRFGLAANPIATAKIRIDDRVTFVPPRSRSNPQNRPIPTRPYMAAYLPSSAMPKAAPANAMARFMVMRPVTPPISARRPSDQNSSKGVSVDITKPPSATAGRKVQRSAAQRPALPPPYQKAARHNTSAVRR